MFNIEGSTITLSSGDTGSMVINATGRTFGADDRALFTVSNENGTQVLMESEYEITDGHFTVVFTNDLTDDWEPGTYKWEVRFVINPVRETVDGEQVITGGEVVNTPMIPQDLVVLGTLRHI